RSMISPASGPMAFTGSWPRPDMARRAAANNTRDRPMIRLETNFESGVPSLQLEYDLAKLEGAFLLCGDAVHAGFRSSRSFPVSVRLQPLRPHAHAESLARCGPDSGQRLRRIV